MAPCRHGSAQMSMEVYAKPKPERLRAAVEAVADRLEAAAAEDACCTDVAQAIGAEEARPVSPEPVRGLRASESGIPTGIRTPVSRLRIWRPRPD